MSKSSVKRPVQVDFSNDDVVALAPKGENFCFSRFAPATHRANSLMRLLVLCSGPGSAARSCCGLGHPVPARQWHALSVSLSVGFFALPSPAVLRSWWCSQLERVHYRQQLLQAALLRDLVCVQLSELFRYLLQHQVRVLAHRSVAFLLAAGVAATLSVWPFPSNTATCSVRAPALWCVTISRAPGASLRLWCPADSSGHQRDCVRPHHGPHAVLAGPARGCVLVHGSCCHTSAHVSSWQATRRSASRS